MLALRLAAHRWPQTLGLALAGVALTAPLIGLGTVHRSGLRAVEQSVRSGFGYAHGWKLQATTAAAEVVSKDATATAVSVGRAAVTTASARVESTVWTVDDARAPLGMLVAGRRVRAAGEATLTSHLAEALGVGLGSDVDVLRAGSVGPTRCRVVGLIADPGDRSADLVIAHASSTGALPAPTYWVVPDVSVALDATPGLTATSVAAATTARLERPPGPLVAVAAAMPVIGSLTFVAMLVALLAQLPGTRRDVDALSAAGMPRRHAWRVIAVWMGSAASVGAVIGSAGAGLLVGALRAPLSRALGQRWLDVDVPIGICALLPVLALAAGTVPAVVLGRGTGASPRWRLPGGGVARGISLVGAVVGLAGVAAVVTAVGAVDSKVRVGHPELLGLAGVLAVTVGARSVVELAVLVPRDRATTRLTQRLAANLAVGATSALLVAVACSGYDAWHTHNTRALERLNLSPQAPGSYLVFDAPKETAASVLARYRDGGGHRSFVFDLPDESDGSVRAATTTVAQCLERERSRADVVASCLRSRGGVLNTVALDPTLPPSGVRAERDVRDESGDVALVRFGPDGRSVLGTRRVRAAPDPDLGGNMPGLLISPEGPVAREQALTPSGLVEFGIVDFGSLDPSEAARIRQMVAQTAPAAQVSDSTAPSSEARRLAQGILVSLVGAAVSTMLVLAVGVAAVAGTSEVRRAVGAAGLSARRRLALSGRIIAPGLAGVLIGAILVPWLAPELGVPGDGSIGWSWCLPLASQAVALLGVAVALLRPPRH